MEFKKFYRKTKGSLLFLVYFLGQILTIDTATTGNNLESRIVNGREVTWANTRYQVSIRLEQIDRYFFGSGHFCGGSIIARNIILTAAHCVWNENTKKFRQPKEFSVVMGNLDRTLNNGNTLKLSVSNIITGPYFNEDTFKDDLAIMFLNQSIPENYTSASVIELSEMENIENGKKCIVTGWGLTEKGIPTNKLMYVEVPIIKRSTCSLNYGSEIIIDGMLCAGYMQGERDACAGDSGGPLVCDNKLIGIVSFGLGCALPGYPGVYTNVGHYSQWIRNQTGLDGKLLEVASLLPDNGNNSISSLISTYTISNYTTNYTITNITNTNKSSTVSGSSSILMILLALFSFMKSYWH